MIDFGAVRREHCMRCGIHVDGCLCVTPLDPGTLRVPPTVDAIVDWFEANRGTWKERAQQLLWRRGAVVGGCAGLQLAALIDLIEPIVEDEITRRAAVSRT
jgi:hypothetical protein